MSQRAADGFLSSVLLAVCGETACVVVFVSGSPLSSSQHMSSAFRGCNPGQAFPRMTPGILFFSFLARASVVSSFQWSIRDVGGTDKLW